MHPDIHSQGVMYSHQHRGSTIADGGFQADITAAWLSMILQLSMAVITTNRTKGGNLLYDTMLEVTMP